MLSSLPMTAHARSPSLSYTAAALFPPTPSFIDSTGHLGILPPVNRSHARHASSPDARLLSPSAYPPTARSPQRSPQHSPAHSPKHTPKTFAIPDFSPARSPSSRSPRVSTSHQQAPLPPLFNPGGFDEQHAALLADALLATQQAQRRRTR